MSNINCPKCAHSFTVEDALTRDLEGRMRAELNKSLEEARVAMDQQKQQLLKEQQAFEQKKKSENEIFAQRLLQEKQKLETELQSTLRKSIGADYDNEMRLLKQNMADNEEKLKAARQKEYEFLRREQELKNKEAELELQAQKRLQQERERLTEDIRKIESQRMEAKEQEMLMRYRELEKQLQDQKKLADEMKRKAEQGSMQLQGEVQELMLEELLKSSFPFDQVTEVGKGIRGADSILTVRNHLGIECGKIIFESKRTKSWDNVWIEKLKADMRSTGADVAVLVSQVYPKDQQCFGEKDGVWICSFSEVVAMTSALRHTILRISETKKSEENKGEKMQMLYGYLTGLEFRQQIEGIAEAFRFMKESILKERMQMEKIWKEREKQLERALISTSGMYGSIKGIAGASVNVPLLETDVEDEEEVKPLNGKLHLR